MLQGSSGDEDIVCTDRLPLGFEDGTNFSGFFCFRCVEGKLTLLEKVDS
jgi:hypothetical protein